jgi:hypothetical protein
MAQIFRPRSNTIARISILAVALVLALLFWLFVMLDRSPFALAMGVPVEQPVLFSHDLHVNQVKLDCRYCHIASEQSQFAGIPSTHTCMTCHSQILPESPLLADVVHSYEADWPLVWNRVHLLSDSIYFHHGIHTQKGIGCETCHGRVDQMPLVWQVEPLTMEWCLECHRQPEQFIRPVEEVFTMGWEPPEGQAVVGPRLVQEYGIRVEQLDNCSICHR